MNIAKQIDKLYALRQERLAAQKEVDALKEAEDALRAEVFALVKAAPGEQAAGVGAQAKITRTVVPQLVDPDAFIAWARRSPKRADIYKVSVVTPAWRMHVASGETPDGVESFTKEELSITKVK